MDVLIQSLEAEWTGIVKGLPRFGLAVIVFAVFVFMGRSVGRGVVALLERGTFRRVHKQFFRRLTWVLFTIVGLILFLNLMGLRSVAVSLVAGGGITAIGLGFAFREIGENFLAGLFLAFSRPFDLDDLIQSGDFQGVVQEIELRHTHIRSADGRDIYIPSSQIFNSPLINFTKDGLRRLSFIVGIDYRDDPKKARHIVQNEVGGVEHVLADPEPGTTVTQFQPQYLEIEAFFWVNTFEKGVSMMGVRTEVMERCRTALLSAGITLSSDVTNNISLESTRPLEVSVKDDESDGTISKD